jgi:hypothetical protein
LFGSNKLKGYVISKEYGQNKVTMRAVVIKMLLGYSGDLINDGILGNRITIESKTLVGRA